MLDKLKDLNNLRKTQAQMKKELESIFIKKESSKFNVLLRGDKRIEKLEIEGVESKELKEFLNDALKEIDKKVEKQMRGHLSDLGINL